jgi:ribosomal protein S24E
MNSKLYLIEVTHDDAEIVTEKEIREALESVPSHQFQVIEVSQVTSDGFGRLVRQVD